MFVCLCTCDLKSCRKFKDSEEFLMFLKLPIDDNIMFAYFLCILRLGLT